MNIPTHRRGYYEETYQEDLKENMNEGEELSNYLYYDESSPTFLRWKVIMLAGKNHNVVKAYPGSPAGSPPKCGRRAQVSVNKVRYKSHRVVWELHYGKVPKGFVIDHIDRDYTNNVISNLRAVAQNINSKNRPKMSNNTSGTTGVVFWTWTRGAYSYDYWIARWEVKGASRQKKFSVLKLGFDLAKELAMSYREVVLKELVLSEGYTENHGE